MPAITNNQSKIMRYFSTLAGPLKKPQPNSDGKVSIKFHSVARDDSAILRAWSHIMAWGTLALTLSLGAILFYPDHWIARLQPQSSTNTQNIIMLICLMLLQALTVIGTLSASRSTVKAKDPIPLKPPKKLRVAFATTRAPGEPVDMVIKTLLAAKQVTYSGGTVDVWLLDETADNELRTECRNLGVNYFTRKDVIRWNSMKPKVTLYSRLWQVIRRKKTNPADIVPYNPYFAGKTKHGNFNSWFDYLDIKNISYDILAGVDTDQVPEPNFLERTLGYFHDENVGFVIGPQVYGNYRSGLDGLVIRCAESQASFFQSTIQRAGNAAQAAMFVGTNYAVRVNALRQVGGFQPCITEDMATSLAIHSHTNPTTGKSWKSVYTPDVLAVGEGPDFWGPYFTQQWRWAAGTFDTWRRTVWRIFHKLPHRARAHYLLMLLYYPSVALMWLISAISSMIYLIWGATAVIAPWQEFASLYMMSLTMQLSLYFWNRRYNVSPHEPQGSYGVGGMAISALTAPIYFSALMGIVLGKKAQFVVTTKGSSTNPDWFKTFKTHLRWAAVLTAALIYGVINGRDHPAMIIWAAMQIIVCITPFVLGMYVAVRARAKQNSEQDHTPEVISIQPQTGAANA